MASLFNQNWNTILYPEYNEEDFLKIEQSLNLAVQGLYHATSIKTRLNFLIKFLYYFSEALITDESIQGIKNLFENRYKEIDEVWRSLKELGRAIVIFIFL